ncbi:hypothetical protein [Saccharothrix violaceirubra]|uniref:Uncharacterized protein n=1 Tax=Saccharothrix violaceirubra TaxID=413306 RepID=A0A7W7T6H0_9PSEU|nr:hypothetical protein [Saccharothrix violaceirubra]MBB4967462.1 hypothetical protein [Saccharothrix violaceirubra]
MSVVASGGGLSADVEEVLARLDDGRFSHRVTVYRVGATTLFGLGASYRNGEHDRGDRRVVLLTEHDLTDPVVLALCLVVAGLDRGSVVLGVPVSLTTARVDEAVLDLRARSVARQRELGHGSSASSGADVPPWPVPRAGHLVDGLGDDLLPDVDLYSWEGRHTAARLRRWAALLAARAEFQSPWDNDRELSGPDYRLVRLRFLVVATNTLVVPHGTVHDGDPGSDELDDLLSAALRRRSWETAVRIDAVQTTALGGDDAVP